jgi:glutaconate CoA-transferase subunit A
MLDERVDKRIKLEQMSDLVKDGMTLAIGGYLTANKPMAIIRQIIKKGIKDLTVIAFPSSIDVDLLIACGCVRKVICPYIGMESLSPIAPFFRMKAEEGSLEIKEVDVAMVICMLRAAAQNLPYLPWRGGIGTSIPEINPDLKIIEDPFGSGKLVAIPPVSPDLALIHAAQSDIHGNIQHKGKSFTDGLIARASKRVIVQVEKIVSNTEIKINFSETTIPAVLVDGVVLAHYGSHPLSSQGYYCEDEEYIKEYIGAANKYMKGDKMGVSDFTQKYIYAPTSLEDYLEAVGLRRLLSLKED